MRLSPTLLTILCFPVFLHACDRSTEVESPGTEGGASSQESSGDDLDSLFTSAPRKSKEQVIKHYVRRRSKNEPITATEYLQAGKSAIEINDYDAAELLASESIRLEPKNPRAFLLRGQARCSSTEGQYEDALEDVIRARDLGLEDPDVYLNIAKCQDSLGRTQAAIDALSEGIALFPDLRKLYKNRASLYLAQGNNDKALLDYNRILELEPMDALCRIKRAQLNETRGNDEAALEDYKLAARPDPNEGKIPKRPVALKSRAVLLGKLGRHAEAVADLTAALKLDRQDDEIRRLRAVQYIALKKFDLALKDLDRAIENGPEFAQQAYLDRATVYELTGRTELARKDRQAASRLKKKPAERPLFELKESQ
ncbi:MAG: tetratricopeptide repeat protein [Candidatus Obscuribacterales bacterium]